MYVVPFYPGSLSTLHGGYHGSKATGGMFLQNTGSLSILRPRYKSVKVPGRAVLFSLGSSVDFTKNTKVKRNQDAWSSLI